MNELEETIRAIDAQIGYHKNQMKEMLLVSFFIMGFIIGCICEFCYDYYRNQKEFRKRQERYKKML